MQLGYRSVLCSSKYLVANSMCDTYILLSSSNLQERLAALDLENKRAAFERSSRAYESATGKISRTEGEVDAAQQAANQLRAAVNEKVTV